LWIPGLIASAREFAAGAIGAWIGLLVTVVVRRAYKRGAAVLPARALAAALQETRRWPEGAVK
jgi:hypothetical protein